MKLKRIASAFLAGALALSLAACGSSASTSAAASASGSAAGSASAAAGSDLDYIKGKGKMVIGFGWYIVFFNDFRIRLLIQIKATAYTEHGRCTECINTIFK